MTAAESAPQPAIPEDGGASLRAFNRFELKYLADRDLVRDFRDGLTTRLEADGHGVDGMYQVWSCYYDSSDLRFYWEKVDGLRFRRKLRIRHYGSPDELGDDTPVWIEIKQRVNRATQKRRLRLPYTDALALCRGREPGTVEKADRPVADEVQRLVGELALRPVAVVGYVREAFFGRDAEAGLRVTIDSRLRGRDRDLDLRSRAESRFIVNPRLSVVEVKVNERVPYWLTERVARQNLQLVRLSKYCQGIEAFGLAPRSVSHIPEGEN